MDYWLPCIQAVVSAARCIVQRLPGRLGELFLIVTSRCGIAMLCKTGDDSVVFRGCIWVGVVSRVLSRT